MQALNSQRKAFLDMVAWSEGTDNGRQPTRNHGYDVIVGGELFTDDSDHPRLLVDKFQNRNNGIDKNKIMFAFLYFFI